MGGTVFWNADWFPGLLLGGVVFVVGASLLARFVLSVKRRAARAASEESTVVQPAVPNRAVVGGAAEKPATAPLPAQIGRYRIENKLGKGAMGEVFLGRDAETGQLAAIKTLALAQEFAPDELAEVRARFFREAETAGRLRHPHIVAILDSGEDGDLAFIAMEYLAGTDLRPFTRTGQLLPLEQVAGVVARIADALAYAHSGNVVHRDVKPANVMYDPATDAVRVMDFGIARITDSSRTKTGMVLGTPSYMSPEQLLGKKVDGRSDLYSLGVMLYQMACGQPPFVGQSMGQLMLRIANEACPDVRAANPRVSEALASVIERATRKDAAQRFQTGEEMARALRACFASDSESGFEQQGR
jgi:serine/threonine-protein kinase